MTCQQLLNSIGLVLGMVGVLVIFRFGPPQPTHEFGVGLSLEDNTPLPGGRTVVENNRDVERNKERYSCMSKVGLAFVFFGFALQLSAIWI